LRVSFGYGAVPGSSFCKTWINLIAAPSPVSQGHSFSGVYSICPTPGFRLSPEWVEKNDRNGSKRMARMDERDPTLTYSFSGAYGYSVIKVQGFR
jgi:hypothetical protein